jgi:hypothetical protein
MLNPTIVFKPSESWQLFALVSLPMAQRIRDAGEQDEWRLGAGLMYSFTAEGHGPVACSAGSIAAQR